MITHARLEQKLRNRGNESGRFGQPGKVRVTGAPFTTQFVHTKRSLVRAIGKALKDSKEAVVLKV